MFLYYFMFTGEGSATATLDAVTQAVYDIMGEILT